MKLIKGIVRPNKVDDIKDALAKRNISGMTVTEVRGHGWQKGHSSVYRGREYEVSLLPKMEIDVVVPGEADEKKGQQASDEGVVERLGPRSSDRPDRPKEESTGDLRRLGLS